MQVEVYSAEPQTDIVHAQATQGKDAGATWQPIPRRPASSGAVSGLASALAKLVGGGCIIRGRADLDVGGPLACAHVSTDSLVPLRVCFAANPHAFAGACSAHVVQTRRVLHLPAITSTVLRLWSESQASAYLQQHQIRSLIVAPVPMRTEIRATLVLWREARSPRFKDADAQVLCTLAARLAPILLRARP